MEKQASTPRDPSSVLVSPALYRLCWWVVVIIHAVAAVFVLFFGFTHLVMSTKAAHASTSALMIPIPLKLVSGVCYMSAATLNLRGLLVMVKDSCRLGSLTMGKHLDGQDHRAANRQRSQLSTPRHIRAVYQHAWTKLFTPSGTFGIHGPFFDVSLLFREVIEVLLQSYQLWALSHSVSRPWINSFAVATVVLNCWSVPVVNAIFRHNESRHRLMCLVVDMYLDFTCAVVVPVFIMLLYLHHFNWSRLEFPPQLVLSDAWYANAVAEGRHVLVTSYIDFLSSLLPQYSIYSCLSLLKQIVRREMSTTRALRPVPIAPTPFKESPLLHVKCRVRKDNRFVCLATVILAMWGVCVLGFHFRSTLRSRPTSAGCRVHLHPWLTNEEAYLVMVVNCHERGGVNGSSDDIITLLDPLHRSILSRLVFVGCPALELPPLIQEFHSLLAITTVHSNLVRWGMDAAITQATHPSLVIVRMISTTMESSPAAVYHGDIPRSMAAMDLINCTIDSVPQDLGEVWSGTEMYRIAFEQTAVPLPPSLGKIQALRELWLVNSSVAALPTTFFEGTRLISLRLSGNPLTELPDLEDTSSLVELYVEFTGVTEAPEWVS